MDTAYYKMIAFILGAVVAAYAGALDAHLNFFVPGLRDRNRPGRSFGHKRGVAPRSSGGTGLPGHLRSLTVTVES